MSVEFETSDGSLGKALEIGVRPRVRVTGSNHELPWHGERVIGLLRKGGVSSAVRRQARAVP